jgi:hypothetical protein
MHSLFLKSDLISLEPEPKEVNEWRCHINSHLNRRDIFKQDRSAALAEWRQLAA